MQLSRRSSERELSDGAKKRATSAGGLNRPDGEIKYVFVLFCFGILFCYFICLSFTYTTTHKKHKTLFFNEVSSYFFSFTDLFHHFRLSLEQIYSHLVSFIHIYFGITCRTEKKQSITHALKKRTHNLNNLNSTYTQIQSYTLKATQNKPTTTALLLFCTSKNFEIFTHAHLNRIFDLSFLFGTKISNSRLFSFGNGKIAHFSTHILTLQRQWVHYILFIIYCVMLNIISFFWCNYKRFVSIFRCYLFFLFHFQY